MRGQIEGEQHPQIRDEGLDTMPSMCAAFSTRRLRRLRRGSAVRDAVADVSLEPRHLVMPLFIHTGDDPEPVASMPGVSRLPVRDAVRTVRELSGRGVRSFLLFGVTPEAYKDATGSYAASPDAPVNRTLNALRDAEIDAALIADACFCEYTQHGHCGVLEGESAHRVEGRTVDNDATLALLGEAAVAQARAGADIIAPSGMMDGQVAAIRTALDAAGFPHTAILSYSVKYASAFYGPFRDAGGCSLTRDPTKPRPPVAPLVASDRRGYQMDPRRTREWRLELARDLEEGADLVMVKPAMAYLDIVAGVRAACDVPVVAYHVSGEYAMLHAAADRGWLDLHAAALEATYAMRRAGADLVVSYFTPLLSESLVSD